MVSWNSLAFLMIQQVLVIWSLLPLPFLNPVWTSGSSWFTYCWKPGLENFEHYFTSMWDECSCVVVGAFFGIAFLRDWNENWPVQNWKRSRSRMCIVILLHQLTCKVHHRKCWAGWLTSWNQDCLEKYQQPQICRWYQFNGRKWRGTKEPLDESERGE